jgi:hypothetical protein
MDVLCPKLHTMTHEERKQNLKNIIKTSDYDPDDVLNRYVENLLDWAETDNYIRDRVRGILSDKCIDGDSYGVPTVEDIVDNLVDMILALRGQ